jgi:hypothetical protein
MTSHREPEINAAPDERAPLLAQDAARYDAGAEREDGDLTSEPQKPDSKTWYYAWRGFCVVLGILIIAVFVKGWIDADDVNVSALRRTINLSWTDCIFSWQFDLKGALKRALGGGLSGAAAMILQVLLLMPIRTIMNYQYRHGTSLSVATKTLREDGGFGRYYQGLGAALFQGILPCTSLAEASGD